MTTAADLALQIKDEFGKLISEPMEFRGEVTLDLADANKIVEVCEFAKRELGFDYLIDISTLDHHGDDPRFSVVYELYGIGREAYDMMGVKFADHPNLKRILMWEGYPYFPLRKDFPLEGKPTEVPGVAFTNVAPMAGGPFVTVAGGKDSTSREPRRRNPEDGQS